MKLFAPEHLNNNDNNSKRKYKKIMIRTKNELFAFNKEIISSVFLYFLGWKKPHMVYFTLPMENKQINCVFENAITLIGHLGVSCSFIQLTTVRQTYKPSYMIFHDRTCKRWSLITYGQFGIENRPEAIYQTLILLRIIRWFKLIIYSKFRRKKN